MLSYGSSIGSFGSAGVILSSSSGLAITLLFNSDFFYSRPML